MAKSGKSFLFDGLGVSPGIAIGPAFVLEPASEAHAEAYHIEPQEVEGEITRFTDAVEKARLEIESIRLRVSESVDPQQAAIFEAHKAMLGDPYLIDRTIRRIREDRRNAEYVFWAVTRSIGDQLARIGDEYFSERNHDLYEVARRVLKFLAEFTPPDRASMAPGSIVVAPDLGPAETADFAHNNVAGICTNTGGPTSHTSILAKALGIPAVVGLDYITHYVRTGDMLIVDGATGRVILNPSADQLSFYEDLAREEAANREALAQIVTLSPTTADGTHVRLRCNIEFPEEVEAAVRHGAEGIGLYRTEFLFMEKGKLPSEDQQLQAYRTVIDRFGDDAVTIRTLDVGGDKMPGAFSTPLGDNPFLGLRALRLCLVNPELFKLQLRPLLRAADGKTLRLMLPMVASLDEVQDAREVIWQVRARLLREGLGVPERLLIGAMIEIPSAALIARSLARICDFFSIGTNDLTQYTLAVDRVNKSVAHLFQETHPAVLGLIQRVVEAGEAAGIPVSVCGEMAGDPRLALLLVGLGVRDLSVSPGTLPAVKRAIRSVNRAALEPIARRALTLETSREIQQLLEVELKDLKAEV